MSFGRRLDGDNGSTIPLILGMFLIALLLVAGSVAAGDAFVQQRQLQDLCDGAAVAAAASSADVGDGREIGPGARYLVLAAVDSAVDQYRQRDPDRAGVTMVASLSTDRTSVFVACQQRRSIAFGSLFGYGDGVTHHATSTSRARLQTN